VDVPGVGKVEICPYDTSDPSGQRVRGRFIKVTTPDGRSYGVGEDKKLSWCSSSVGADAGEEGGILVGAGVDTPCPF
jgi:hypothetical protein